MAVYICFVHLFFVVLIFSANGCLESDFFLLEMLMWMQFFFMLATVQSNLKFQYVKSLVGFVGLSPVNQL